MIVDPGQPSPRPPTSLSAAGALASAALSGAAGLFVWPLALASGSAADTPAALGSVMATSVCLVMGLVALVLLGVSFLDGRPVARGTRRWTFLCLLPFAVLTTLVLRQLLQG
jgi:hypothetical protein